jgi:hypothetical protein
MMYPTYQEKLVVVKLERTVVRLKVHRELHVVAVMDLKLKLVH